MRAESRELVRTPLSHWSEFLATLFEEGQTRNLFDVAKVVLKRLPQHLPTYQLLLQAALQLKHWEEAADWGTRLLRADPSNELAWQAVALKTEEQGEREQARAIWLRAFEANPYAPDIRAGLSRTTLSETKQLELNQACLATLYMRMQRWRQAADLYAALIQANRQRLDFQIWRMIALWQDRSIREARQLAQNLVYHQCFLLIPWVVLEQLGDRNDKALALNPIQSMDPDGEYASNRTSLPLHRAPIEITVTEEELMLFEIMI
ncbi:hypothetical protein KFU94_54460 [Chloroflexi bacterium TSY]|nr:hypothetical protein [Chloroflexi bacterium TSY]